MNEPHRISPRHQTFAPIYMLVAVVITGCATTIAQPPFQEFAESVQKVRSGADTALGALYDQTRTRYIDDTAQGGAALDAVLLTAAPDDPFEWRSSSASPPLFLTEARFREGVYRLNTSLVDYATALRQLASPDLLSPETFNTLAAELNGNLNKALPALGVRAPAEDVAIFSAAATAAFRLYLENKQRSTLAEALTRNQGAIHDTAGLGSSAVQITVRAVGNEYAERSAALAREIQRADAPLVDRRARAKDLIELNDGFIKELAILRALNRSTSTCRLLMPTSPPPSPSREPGPGRSAGCTSRRERSNGYPSNWSDRTRASSPRRVHPEGNDGILAGRRAQVPRRADDGREHRAGADPLKSWRCHTSGRGASRCGLPHHAPPVTNRVCPLTSSLSGLQKWSPPNCAVAAATMRSPKSGAGDVAVLGDGLAPDGPDPVDGIARGLFVEIVDHDPGSVPGRRGRLLPDAAPRPGDDGDLAVELAHGVRPPCSLVLVARAGLSPEQPATRGMIRETDIRRDRVEQPAERGRPSRSARRRPSANPCHRRPSRRGQPARGAGGARPADPHAPPVPDCACPRGIRGADRGAPLGANRRRGCYRWMLSANAFR